MLFCSLNSSLTEMNQAKRLLHGKVLEKDQIVMDLSEVKSSTSDYISYDSLISIFGIVSFPYYVIINSKGKVIYRDRKFNY